MEGTELIIHAEKRAKIRVLGTHARAAVILTGFFFVIRSV